MENRNFIYYCIYVDIIFERTILYKYSLNKIKIKLISTDVFKMNPLQGDLMPDKTEQRNIHQQNGQEQRSVWGNHTLPDVTQVITTIYDEIVFWRRNVFMLPTGATAKRFLCEMTRLINIWNEQVDPLKVVDIKAFMVMPALLLQKPCYKSKSKLHSA